MENNTKKAERKAGGKLRNCQHTYEYGMHCFILFASSENCTTNAIAAEVAVAATEAKAAAEATQENIVFLGCTLAQSVCLLTNLQLNLNNF